MKLSTKQQELLKEIRKYEPQADIFGFGKLSVKEAQQLAYWLLRHIEIISDACATSDADSEVMQNYSIDEIWELKDTLAVLQNIYEFNNVSLKELVKCGYYGKKELKINK